MKGLSFDNFIVHETNQAAYDVCRKLATLDAELARPVVLLGENASGKSHLLWGIVDYYRRNNVKVGVALIAANDFPEKVKRLAENPAKLKQNLPVVLLVDDLHQFDQEMADLEKVFFTFHENGHQCVFATSVHPNVIPGLSGKFKALLNGGMLVGIKVLPKKAGSIIPEPALQQISKLKTRIRELEKNSTGADEEVAVIEELEQECQAARAALKRSEGELGSLREELLKAAEERNAAQAETKQWQELVAALADRVETQKRLFTERIAALDAACTETAHWAHALSGRKQPDDNASDYACSVEEEVVANEFNLSKAHQQLAIQTAEIDQLRQTSSELSETLHRQETEVRRVISDVRESLAGIDIIRPVRNDKEVCQERKAVLSKVVEQLRELEEELPVPAPEEDTELLYDAAALQSVEALIIRETKAFPEEMPEGAATAAEENAEEDLPELSDAWESASPESDAAEEADVAEDALPEMDNAWEMAPPESKDAEDVPEEEPAPADESAQSITENAEATPNVQDAAIPDVHEDWDENDMNEEGKMRS